MTEESRIDFEQFENLQRHRGWLVALGIALLLMGSLAIVLPLVASLTIALLIGWLLVIGGVLHLFHAFRSQRWVGVVLEIPAAVLYLAAGFVTLLYPFGGLITLTLVLGAFFAIEGLLKILASMRARPMPNWGWLMFNGIISLLLGLLVWAGWPGASAWVVGTLFGIDLIIGGWSMIILAMTARDMVVEERGICFENLCFSR